MTTAFDSHLLASAPNETAALINMDVRAGYKSTASHADSFRAATASVLSDDDGMLLGDDNMHRTNCWETFLYLIKGYLGAGCLSLPWAVSQLGVTGGVVAIFALSLWSSYNCWTIVELRHYIDRTQKNPTSPIIGGEEEVSSMASASTRTSNITYPDVGQWAYGKQFQRYVRVCICVLQVAVCTVYVSFVGENLLAVLVRLNVPASHWAVMTMELPIIFALAMIPNLKLLAPIMAVGTMLLIVCFAAIGVIIRQEWSERPDELPPVNPSAIPLALCAILYSYEGICLILPVESAMKEPEKFQTVFVSAMAVVATALAAFSSVCVYVFGNVTNGSMTAFLVETYRDDPKITFWLMVANTAVSLSVLLTYPLTIFPALELLAEWFVERASPFAKIEKRRDSLFGDDDDEFAAFEPLPPLPEDGVASLDFSVHSEHLHRNEIASQDGHDKDDMEEAQSYSGLSSVTSVLPQTTMPGDSLKLRASLVLIIFFVAVAVPNVQALISLAGALAGSSIALLIPPILELAWIRQMEQNPAIEVDSHFWMLAPATGSWGIFWIERCKCYVLLALGIVFLLLGTYFSVADIVRIYRADMSH